MDIYHQIETSADQSKQIDLFKQILQIAQEQFYVLGISLISNGYGIVKNNMHNVPAKMFSTGGQWPNPAPTNPCEYFYE
jgi:peptide/nickel transport system substrate-binding protein